MRSMYYPGYEKAFSDLRKKNDDELLQVLDELFGRDNLPENYTHGDLFDEAYRQMREEWMTPEGNKRMKDVVAFVRAVDALEKIKKGKMR